MGGRLALARAFVDRRRNFEVSLFQTLTRGVFVPPCNIVGARYVTDVRNDGDFIVAQLKGIRSPLYWPRQLGRHDLYKVATDCLYADGWHYYEVPETRVAPGDVVIDCGAAEGLFSLSVANRAKKVFAFEPWSGFAGCLRKTFASHDNVSHVAVALSDEPGTAYLAGESLYASLSTEDQGRAIPVTSLDAWCRETGQPISFIKADLEGSEMKLLLGARASIRRFGPKIAITTYHVGNDWGEMVKLLRQIVPSYKFRVKGLSFNSGQPRPVMLHAWTEGN